VGHWKLGDRWAYITSRGKRGIVDKLSDVPSSAKTKTTGATKKKPQKSSPKKKTTRRKKTVPKKKKTSKKGGFKLPGGIGPKGILQGVLGLAVVPRFIPSQSPGVKVLGTGIAMRALSLGGGGPLSAAGLIMTAAEFLNPYLTGVMGTGMSRPSGPGGYDY
jgi:hypothetical protein